MNGLPPIDYRTLDPGIRDVVKILREEWHFNTTDSGDGSKASFMEGAMDVPNVAVVLDGYQGMGAEADRLGRWADAAFDQPGCGCAARWDGGQAV